MEKSFMWTKKSIDRWNSVDIMEFFWTAVGIILVLLLILFLIIWGFIVAISFAVVFAIIALYWARVAVGKFFKRLFAK